MSPLNHLILVCCHAIYLGGPSHGASEDEWLIEPFQQGETPTFTSHAKAGLKAWAEDPRALLVFSGYGSTVLGRESPNTVGLLTYVAEAPLRDREHSLLKGNPTWANISNLQNLVKDNHYFQNSCKKSIDESRIIAESHATDSYQNVLFSLLQFRLHAGVYPRRVTVVTHEFKRARFMECHFPAVGLLPWEGAQDADHSSVSVIGINPPETISPLEVLIQGESKRGIGLWRQDLYGVGVELAGKRNQRGWDPGMKDIFVDKGLEEVVEQLVCWDGGQCNAWFSRMEELPWHYRAPVG